MHCGTKQRKRVSRCERGGNDSSSTKKCHIRLLFQFRHTIVMCSRSAKGFLLNRHKTVVKFPWSCTFYYASASLRSWRSSGGHTQMVISIAVGTKYCSVYQCTTHSSSAVGCRTFLRTCPLDKCSTGLKGGTSERNNSRDNWSRHDQMGKADFWQIATKRITFTWSISCKTITIGRKSMKVQRKSMSHLTLLSESKLVQWTVVMLSRLHEVSKLTSKLICYINMLCPEWPAGLILISLCCSVWVKPSP